MLDHCWHCWLWSTGGLHRWLWSTGGLHLYSYFHCIQCFEDTCNHFSAMVIWIICVKNWRFYWSKVLLPTCSCWWQLAHLDYREDARDLNSVNLHCLLAVYVLEIVKLLIKLLILFLNIFGIHYTINSFGVLDEWKVWELWAHLD